MRKFEASRVSGVGRIDLEEVGYLLGQCRPIETVHFDEAVYKFACNLAGLPATEEETIIDRWLISVVKGRFEKGEIKVSLVVNFDSSFSRVVHHFSENILYLFLLHEWLIFMLWK